MVSISHLQAMNLQFPLPIPILSSYFLLHTLLPKIPKTKNKYRRKEKSAKSLEIWTALSRLWFIWSCYWLLLNNAQGDMTLATWSCVTNFSSFPMQDLSLPIKLCHACEIYKSHGLCWKENLDALLQLNFFI